MSQSDSVQDLIDNLRGGGMDVDEIRPHLNHASALVRSNAIEAMVMKLPSNPETLYEIIEALVDPRNSTRLMGTISVAHVGMVALFRSSCKDARQLAKTLLATWPRPGRDDLLWYLRSEGISVE